MGTIEFIAIGSLAIPLILMATGHTAAGIGILAVEALILYGTYKGVTGLVSGLPAPGQI